MICCLAVAPAYRRRGVATMLMDEALTNLDRTKEISVSTFRADDEKGPAPRALYEKYGFVADELIEEFDYPNQKFVLHPIGAGEKPDSSLLTAWCGRSPIFLQIVSLLFICTARLRWMISDWVGVILTFWF